jgi:alanine racemase
VIDLGAFRHNMSCVRSYCGPQVKIMAVVKANGYGHGAVHISQEAVRAGAEYLAVTRVEEALELRRHGILHPLLVFELARDSSIGEALAANVELTVSTLEGAETISRIAAGLGITAKVHVKIDTGMVRLGFDFHTAAASIAALVQLPSLALKSVYSHLATSDDPDQTFARDQLDRYNSVVKELAAMGISVPLRHIANSGAILTLPEAHLDMVRPGILLYGYTPARHLKEQFPVTPVMSLQSVVTFLRTVEPGTSISYGRNYVTTQRTTIATVPIGYADGYSRLLTNRTDALVRGRRVPVVGSICMDQVMLDLGEKTDCTVGDLVTFIGRDGKESISAWDLAEIIGTIPYEITCLLTGRVPRVDRE